MKKLIIAIALFSATLTSCKKEDITCEPTSCGAIVNDGITNGCYWLEIENDCSGNKKKFCFDQDIWTNNFVGDRFCVTNVTSW